MTLEISGWPSVCHSNGQATCRASRIPYWEVLALHGAVGRPNILTKVVEGQISQHFESWAESSEMDFTLMTALGSFLSVMVPCWEQARVGLHDGTPVCSANSVPGFPTTVFPVSIFSLPFLRPIPFSLTSEACVGWSLGSKCLSFFPVHSLLSMPSVSFLSLPVVVFALVSAFLSSVWQSLDFYLLLAVR